MRRVRIKVCGITNPHDALLAAEMGADAIGLIFCESPRRVDVEQAKRIVDVLPPFVTSVGVFLDSPADEVVRTARLVGLGAVQLHGSESPGTVREVARSIKVIKAFRVKGPETFDECSSYSEAAAFLFDTYVKGQAGGTGLAFDWSLLDGDRTPILKQRPWILAGGLRSDNVAEALSVCRPYGVDVSSGVEREPGIKDADKLSQFISKVRHIPYEL